MPLRLAAGWLDDPAPRAVMAALAAGGEGAWYVGGCVRNALMGLEPGDIDITTTARPETTVRLAGAAGLRAVPTGAEHGTITVVVQGQGIEVTTLRRDVETDGRHAVVVFSDRIEEDAARRDFTMNALYALADGTVIDPLGGLDDLRAGHVRFIGEADQRIAEDYLRILRFFRFTAWYGAPGLGIDAEGLAACAAGQEGLERLAGERIGHEMRRLLAAPDPAPAVAAMAASGILARILPGADATGLAPLVAFEDGASPDWLRRLTALGGDPARLRLTRAETRGLARLRDALAGDIAATVLAQEDGFATGRDLVLIRAALTGMPLAPDWQPRLDRAAAAKFPVAAADLMPQWHGPALGRRLAVLRQAWIASDFTLGRDDLLALPGDEDHGAV